MRFSRLKKHIEASKSISTPPPVATKGKAKISCQGEHENSTKRKRITKQNHSTLSKLARDQIDKVEGEPKVKSETTEPELVAPSAPVKRQTRGKKIDAVAAFESDSSPTPGARTLSENNTSYDEDSHAAAEEDESSGGVDSEHERPSKRRRSSPPETKLTRQGPNRRLFFNNRSEAIPWDVSKQLFSRSDAAELSLRSPDPQIQTTSPSTPVRDPRPDPSTFNHPSDASRTTLSSTMPNRSGATSLPSPQTTSTYPTPPDSNFTSGLAISSSFNDETASENHAFNRT